MGIFLPKALRNIPRKTRNTMTNLPEKQWAGSSQSQGLGDTVLRDSKATLGLSLAHPAGQAHPWGTSSSLGTAGAELTPGRGNRAGTLKGHSGFTAPRGSPGPSAMGTAPC